MNTLSETAIICIETGRSTFGIINGCLDKKCLHEVFIENVSEPGEALEMIDDLVEDGLVRYLLISNDVLLSESQKFITSKIKSEYPEIESIAFSNASSKNIRESLKQLVQPREHVANRSNYSQMSA